MSYPSNRPPNFRLEKLYVLTAIDPATNAEGIIHVTDATGQTHMLVDSDERLVKRVFTDESFLAVRTHYPELRVLCFSHKEDVTAQFRTAGHSPFTCPGEGTISMP